MGIGPAGNEDKEKWVGINCAADRGMVAEHSGAPGNGVRVWVI
jgi:hypothetical protein